MSMIKKPSFILAIALVAVLAVAVGAVVAQKPARLSTHAGGPGAGPVVSKLPPVDRAPMNITNLPTPRATSVLSFDDGTCESGLGVSGAIWTGVVDFDVPTQCIQSGLEIVQLTARMNTNSATAFAFAQAGATPPAAGSLSTAGISSIAGAGPCSTGGTTGGLATRAITGAVITGTDNFFAGVRAFDAFGGRDTNSPAGRMWALCPTCGMTQYSPTDLSGFGLAGNWMIRVTVEDQNCVPVELMEFSID